MSHVVLTVCGMVDLPRTLSQRSAVALLEAHGWRQTTGGKHAVKMQKPGHRPTTLPSNQRRDYPKGLGTAVLKEAGLTGPAKGQE